MAPPAVPRGPRRMCTLSNTKNQHFLELNLYFLPALQQEPEEEEEEEEIHLQDAPRAMPVHLQALLVATVDLRMVAPQAAIIVPFGWKSKPSRRQQYCAESMGQVLRLEPIQTFRMDDRHQHDQRLGRPPVRRRHAAL